MFYFSENLKVLETADNPYGKKGLFRWQNCIMILEFLTICNNTDQLFYGLLFEIEENDILKGFLFLQKWRVQEVLYSFLFFFLKTTLILC